MPNKPEQEMPATPLLNDEEMQARSELKGFYDFLHDAVPGQAYGPNVLLDTSFDRMIYERPVLGYLIGQTAAKGALDTVMNDARFKEDRTIETAELPNLIVRSLVRMRPAGEWDNSPKSRLTRTELIKWGLQNHGDYPLIASAEELRALLRHDGHDAYALDAVAATSNWLRLVDRKKSLHVRKHLSDPAA